MPTTTNPPKKTTQKPLINPPTKPLLSLLFMLLSLFSVTENPWAAFSRTAGSRFAALVFRQYPKPVDHHRLAGFFY